MHQNEKNTKLTSVIKSDKNVVKMKLKNKWFIFTAACYRALRITPQDPIFCLDFYRETVLCLYRRDTAFSLRVGSRRWQSLKANRSLRGSVCIISDHKSLRVTCVFIERLVCGIGVPNL